MTLQKTSPSPLAAARMPTASLMLLTGLLAGCHTEAPEPVGAAESAVVECDPATFQASCSGNRLTTCDQGVRVTRECGPFVCNAAAASCGWCGNGVIDPGEQCDDANANAHDGCLPDCTVGPLCDPATFEARCDGNALVLCEAGVEAPRSCGALQCDEGRARCGSCGDSVLDPGEECDYPDLTDGDGCDTNCTVSRCGNGVRAGGEACDDGNAEGGDGCRADCAGREVCGDGLLDAAAGEQCEGPGTVDAWAGLACGADCRLRTGPLGPYEPCALTPYGSPSAAELPDSHLCQQGLSCQSFQSNAEGSLWLSFCAPACGEDGSCPSLGESAATCVSRARGLDEVFSISFCAVECQAGGGGQACPDGTWCDDLGSGDVGICAQPSEIRLTSGPPTFTGNPVATFEFESGLIDPRFECSLDAGEWVPCDSPWTVEVDTERDPSHIFDVRASVAGDPVLEALHGGEHATVSFTWTVDTRGPESRNPDCAAYVYPTSDGVEWAVSYEDAFTNVAGIECLLDGDPCQAAFSPAFEECEDVAGESVCAPVTYPIYTGRITLDGVAPGSSHTVSLVPVDELGNLGTTCSYELEVPFGDADDDGVLDDADACPNEPEDFDGIDDLDGCPEPDDGGCQGECG